MVIIIIITFFVRFCFLEKENLSFHEAHFLLPLGPAVVSDWSVG